MRGREIRQLIMGRGVRNGKGPSHRGEKQCIRGEKGDEICGEQGMVHPGEGKEGSFDRPGTLGGNGLEGRVIASSSLWRETSTNPPIWHKWGSIGSGEGPEKNHQKHL